MNILAVLIALTPLAQAQPTTAQPAATAQPDKQPAGPYKILKSFPIGGEGSWDLLAVDPDAKRLYVSRATRVIVVDTETGAQVGEIPNTQGVHGIAIAPGLNKGFTTNGRTDDSTVFDLKTLKPIKNVKTGKNPDAIAFEPVTKRVFVFNGRSNDATVFSAEDFSEAGTVALGGKPELAVVDGQGKLFVNLEDTSELLRIDAQTLKVEQRISLAPGSEPTGLAIDAKNHRLFAACGNQKMVVVDAVTGKVLGTPVIGKGVDGAEFDAAGGLALSSNGEGTMTVISTANDKFEVVQTLTTAPRAKTLAIDPKTRHIFLPAADYETPKEGEKGRPAMKPGTFRILVVGP